jgi:transposase
MVGASAFVVEVGLGHCAPGRCCNCRARRARSAQVAADGHHPDGRIRWQRTDPWETGFVHITGDQALLGQVDGRTSAAVQAWLAARTEAFRAGVEVVVIDPHAGYAAAVRAALPQAAIAVDHFHLIMLANKAVTAVRHPRPAGPSRPPGRPGVG